MIEPIQVICSAKSKECIDCRHAELHDQTPNCDLMCDSKYIRPKCMKGIIDADDNKGRPPKE